MEIALISDTVASSQGFRFSGLRDFSTSNNSQISISAAIFTVDAVARPPVKSNPRRSTTLLRRRRRTKRRSLSGGGDDDDGGYGSVGDWFFGGEGPIFGGEDGGSGFFGGGGGGGGGKGWNFGGFGGQNWDSSPSPPSSPADPAFDFVYEVVSWIVLSNCVHFAFKKVLRAVAGEDEREKVVPIRLTSVC